MRSHRIVTIALVLGVSGSLVTACGDDTEPLSKPDFIEQANAICQVANDEATLVFDGVWERLDEVDQDDPANEGMIFVLFAEAAAQIKPIWGQMADDIRDLQEPDEDHELLETLFDDLDALVIKLVETSAAAADGDQAAMQALDDETEDPFDDLNRRAREYGLTVCGEEI